MTRCFTLCDWVWGVYKRGSTAGMNILCMQVNCSLAERVQWATLRSCIILIHVASGSRVIAIGDDL